MKGLVHCTNCLKPYPEQGVPYCCLHCGGLFDFAEIPKFDPDKMEDQLPGIWRYRHAFGLPDESTIVSLGEGGTPLVWAEVGKNVNVAFKCEFQNPSGSFKDRGSALITSFLLSKVISAAVEDSSGNAGASFAAYAARASIVTTIIVPQGASGPKRAQIEAYGATLIEVPGKRIDATHQAQQVVATQPKQQTTAYGSHAYLPFNLPGYATLAYELAAQVNGGPGTVLIPVGQGGLLLGVRRGFKTLVDAGLLVREPVLVGVQARNCAPLWAVSSYGQAGLGWVGDGETLAEGIRVVHPLRGDAVLLAVEQSGGFFVVVDEEKIIEGRAALAHLGFYVEPTSAVVWDAINQSQHRVPHPIIAVLTGSGLKA